MVPQETLKTTFRIKALIPLHTCFDVFFARLLRLYSWLGNQIGDVMFMSLYYYDIAQMIVDYLLYLFAFWAYVGI